MKPHEAKYHGTIMGSEILTLSIKEIVEKYGALIFCTDDEYNLWCREQMGGNEGIHKSN